MVKINDLKVSLGKDFEIFKEAGKATQHQKAVELALGVNGRDLVHNAERYRLVMGPSEEVKRSFANFAVSKAAIQAQIEKIGQSAALTTISPAVADYLRDHIRLTKPYVTSSEALKHIREQSEAWSTSMYGLRSGDISALKQIDVNRFAIPASEELSIQIANIDANRLYATSRLLGLDQDNTLRAAGAIRSPWMESANTDASLRRFVEFQSIGKAIRLTDAYSDEVSAALRDSLGDYRDAIAGDQDNLSDINIRTALYVNRGLDRDLTDLPEDAFEETLNVTEIRGEPPTLVTIYGPPIDAAADGELEAGFHRNNQAHDWLQRFEAGMRRFIDTLMTNQFGQDWPKRRLPNEMLDNWLEKQNKDPNRERHRRIIVYCDFSDYEKIICKRDNFREVFAPFFVHDAHFRESMRRLSIPRNEISHSRIITHDDELYLYAELRRLTNQFLRRQ